MSALRNAWAVLKRNWELAFYGLFIALLFASGWAGGEFFVGLMWGFGIACELFERLLGRRAREEKSSGSTLIAQMWADNLKNRKLVGEGSGFTIRAEVDLNVGGRTMKLALIDEGQKEKEEKVS